MSTVLNLGGRLFIYLYVAALVGVFLIHSAAGIAAVVAWLLGFAHAF